MSKRRYWLVALGLLSVAVVVVMIVLTYLLLTLPTPADKPISTPYRPVLNLPTAPLPEVTSGPRLPDKALFVPQEPINGYSNCDVYGFKGTIRADSGERLEGFQIVVWDDKAGLVALDTSDATGAYLIKIQAKPAERNLWVQVYQNDIPVSEPLPLKIHIDCRNDFQIYQVNWQKLPMEREE